MIQCVSYEARESREGERGGMDGRLTWDIARYRKNTVSDLPLPLVDLYAPLDFAFWNKCCFWKAFSVCSMM